MENLVENGVDYKNELEEQIRKNLGWGWCGKLDPFTEFVSVALTKHLYDVIAEKSNHKPTFEEWEDLSINKDNLIELLHRLREYQENEDFRLMQIFDKA